MKNLISIRFAGLVVVLVLGMAYNAHALDITPANAIASGAQQDNPGVLAAVNAVCGCVANSVYKQDVGGPESGSLAGSYTTTFQNTPNDPSGFTMVYNGGAIASPTVYLLVKDGQEDPSWYLFNLTALGWNGTDTVTGTLFWPAGGAISHIEVFGSTSVPEPSSILLLGFALVGIGVASRRWLRV